jgi:hypothetical protein
MGAGITAGARKVQIKDKMIALAFVAFHANSF